MDPEMTIKPADRLGPVLAGRAEAIELREDVERRASHGPVVVDLDGVLTMSPSFADELFAKLAADVDVAFENMDEDLQNLANYVRAGRPRS
jgi:hypothetical protein